MDNSDIQKVFQLKVIITTLQVDSIASRSCLCTKEKLCDMGIIQNIKHFNNKYTLNELISSMLFFWPKSDEDVYKTVDMVVNADNLQYSYHISRCFNHGELSVTGCLHSTLFNKSTITSAKASIGKEFDESCEKAKDNIRSQLYTDISYIWNSL